MPRSKRAPVRSNRQARECNLDRAKFRHLWLRARAQLGRHWPAGRKLRGNDETAAPSFLAPCRAESWFGEDFVELVQLDGFLAQAVDLSGTFSERNGNLLHCDGSAAMGHRHPFLTMVVAPLHQLPLISIPMLRPDFVQ